MDFTLRDVSSIIFADIGKIILVLRASKGNYPKWKLIWVDMICAFKVVVST